LDIWEIVEVARDNGGSVAETAAYLEIDPRLVESALRYYGSNREEIDDWIARIHALNEREEAKWHAAREAISG
jgi:ABC-type phosphonate transport system ATPase subunit